MQDASAADPIEKKPMHIVKYSGPFGFIKPWTAVRDIETYSQQFLTPSIVAGMERKLFPELLAKGFGIYRIKRHRLSYSQISRQQEQTQPRGWNKIKNGWERTYSILTRGVLVDPILLLGFDRHSDALRAAKQHICLCRNEDLLYPSEEIIRTDETESDSNEALFSGFELIFEEHEKSFTVGYNRFHNNEPMRGWLKIVGDPVKSAHQL